MEFEARDEGLMQSISTAVEKKEDALDHNIGQYLLRCFYAGLFLTLPTIVGMMAWDIVGAGAPHIGKLFYGLLFPIGLMIIIFLNGELATSNMMYTFAGAHRGWLSWGKAFKIIILCTLFNLIGSIFVGILVGQSSTVSYFGPDSALMSVVNSKLDKTVWVTLIDAILANIYVNIAIIGQMRIKNETGKLFFILATIFLFVYAGFEHLIATFGIFSIAIFAGNGLAWGPVLMNLIVAFIGNLIGGGVVMGLGYSYLNKPGIRYRD